MRLFSKKSAIIVPALQEKARPGCDWLVTNVWQSVICRPSAYGRVAVAYVQASAKGRCGCFVTVKSTPGHHALKSMVVFD